MVEDESNPNIQLLRASIASIRGASPDDTHMTVRYAQFLETLLNAPVRSSSSAEEGAYTGNVAEQEHPHDVSGGPGHAGITTEDVKWWSQYPMTASGPGMESIASLNLHPTLPAGLGSQIVRDPFQ